MTLLEASEEITFNSFPNQQVNQDTNSDLKQVKSQIYTSDLLSLLMQERNSKISTETSSAQRAKANSIEEFKS